MTQPASDVDYYALTSTATEDGSIVWDAQSGFQGVTDTKPPRELRGPCLIDGRKRLELWRNVGTSGLVVITNQLLAIFLHFAEVRSLTLRS